MTNTDAYQWLRLYLVVYLQRHGMWPKRAALLNGPEEGKEWPRSEMRERAHPKPPSEFAADQLRRRGRWEDRVFAQLEPYVGTRYEESASLFERRERYYTTEIGELEGRFNEATLQGKVRWIPTQYRDMATELFEEEYFQALRNTGRCTNRGEFDETTPQLELPGLQPDTRAALEDLLDRLGTHMAHLEAIHRLRHHFDGYDVFDRLPLRRAGSVAEAVDFVMERYADQSRIERKRLVRDLFDIDGFGPTNKRDLDKAVDKAFAKREPKHGVTKEGTPVPPGGDKVSPAESEEEHT